MSSGPRTPGPRHLAGGAPRAPRPDRPADAPLTSPVLSDELAEMAPIAQVPRHRLAFALAVTAAALPILVLDNLPASASSERVEAVASQESAVSLAPLTSEATVIVTTTVAPVASDAADPTTTTTAALAPSTTVAPAQRAVAAVRTTPTTQAPTTTTTAAPAPSGRNGDPNDPATWDRMAQCEAGGNWSINSGNGYYGGLQFSLATWQHYGGTGYPHQASKATQIAIGKKLQAVEGWGAWPGCARQLGYT